MWGPVRIVPAGYVSCKSVAADVYPASCEVLLDRRALCGLSCQVNLKACCAAL